MPSPAVEQMIARETRRLVVETCRECMADLLNRFVERGPRQAEQADAVVEGTLDGLTLWVIANFGRRRAYDVLQRKADAILEQGVDHGGEKESRH